MAGSQAITADRWAGGVCPFGAGWKKVMMWVFIVGDGILFAGFLASYGYARMMATNWPDPVLVYAAPPAILVLIALSAQVRSVDESARYPASLETGTDTGDAAAVQAQTTEQGEHQEPGVATAAVLVTLLLAALGIAGHGVAREAVAPQRAVTAIAGAAGQAHEDT